jgi:hypothetical protein
VHRRPADPAVVAVDRADLLLDLFTHPAVRAETLPARRGDLHHDGVLDRRITRGQQLAERAQPHVDALGVVQSVDPEDDLAGIPEVRPQGSRCLVHLRGGGQRGLRGRVDRDRVGGRPDLPSVVLDRAAGGDGPGQCPGQPPEVSRTAG